MKKLLALLLSAVMLLTLGACGKKAEEPASPDPKEVTALAETFVEAHFLRDYKTKFSLLFYDARKQWEDSALKAHGSEEAFLETAQQQADAKGIDVTMTSFDSYYEAYHLFILDDCRDRYGEYDLTIHVTTSTKMASEDLPTFRDGLLNGTSKEYMDSDTLNAITEVYTVEVDLTVDGDKNDYHQSYLVYVVLLNGQWLVADYTA